MAYTPPGQTRRKIYEFMRERLLAGRPPSLREVQDAFGFRAVESARSQLEALVAEGLLVKEQGRSRGYRLPKGQGGGVTLVPLVGRVQAGRLTEAVRDPEGYLALHSPLPSGKLFALRVEGESMTGVGILPGDLVIVRRQGRAEPGEVVVAQVDDEATVKILRRRQRRGRVQWILEPANPDFSPIVPREGEWRMLGKVVEVHRYLERVPLVDKEP